MQTFQVGLDKIDRLSFIYENEGYCVYFVSDKEYTKNVFLNNIDQWYEDGYLFLPLDLKGIVFDFFIKLNNGCLMGLSIDNMDTLRALILENILADNQYIFFKKSDKEIFSMKSLICSMTSESCCFNEREFFKNFIKFNIGNISFQLWNYYSVYDDEPLGGINLILQIGETYLDKVTTLLHRDVKCIGPHKFFHSSFFLTPLPYP